MLFVVDKPRLQRIISIVREDRSRRKNSNIPFLRINVENEELTISGGCVTATFPATVYQAGVLFIRTTLFRRMLKLTEIGQKFITFQITEDGLRFGDTFMPFNCADMAFFSDPSKAPESWPPTEPEVEQIAEFPEPPYNKQMGLFEKED